MTTENTTPPGDEAQAQEPEVQPVQTERTFTQDEVNRIMNQTKRETRREFSDYSHLQERAAKADELEKAQLTEAEQLQARTAEAERRAVDADQRISQALIASEVKVRASQMGIVDPAAAYLLLDHSHVSYNETDGVLGVDTALTQLLEEKPYLKGQPSRTPNLNPSTGQPAPVLRLTEQQQEAARMFGKTDEEYARGL